MSYIFGAYRATYNGQSLGQVEDGWEHDYGQVAEEISSDLFRARQDAIFQGVDMVIRAVLLEPALSAVRSLVWPWDATYGKTGVTGRSLLSLAKTLTLTACSGNNASPATMTFPKAIIGTDRIVTKLGNTLKKLPVTIWVFPYPSNASLPDLSPLDCDGGTFFTTT